MPMMPTSTTQPSVLLPPEAQPEAWVVVGAGMFPARILAATFQGGILQTQATVEVGQWLPLKATIGGELVMVHIHVLEIAEGRMVFRLYGTDGLARSLWDAFVRDLREASETIEG